MPMKIELTTNLPMNKTNCCNKGDIYWAEWLDTRRNKTVKFTSKATGIECVAFQGEYKILIGEKYNDGLRKRHNSNRFTDKKHENHLKCVGAHV